MAMKDLGENIKKSDMYPTMAEGKEQKVRYPEVSFPLDFVDGLNLKVDDNVDIHIKGRVCGMEDTKWSNRITFECQKGEVTKESKKGESLLE